MDDMTSKIQDLLADPDGMEKIKSMANALFADTSSDPDGNAANNSSIEDDTGFPDINMQSVMKAMSMFKGSSTDSRASLLLALKPHLSEERQKKVDSAVKILKVISFIPILKEQGILDLF